MSRGLRWEPGSGRSLRDLLFDRGVEFPCGGMTQCGGCRVRVVSGEVPITDDMRAVFDDDELAQGWRLGCQAEPTVAVEVEVDQWSGEAAILDDREAVPIEPADGLGAVVDVGTTTMVAQIVDRSTGAILGVETALNPQARHGADLISRIQFEQSTPGVLGRLVREAVGGMLTRLSGGRVLEEVLLVGNTAMHHLFCGLDVAPLAAVPFRSPTLGVWEGDAGALGWSVPLARPSRFLPCCGGFVGSDILAGIVATGLAWSLEPGALLDLGTNGEIVVGDRRGLRCASTAAGPAFEGGRISVGMRAGPGAIDGAVVSGDRLEVRVIGDARAPRGICGSGLVDVVAAARALGWIDRRGRVLIEGKRIPIGDGLALTQSDIRELQLAKGAIAAGLALLLGGQTLATGRVFLAGAFGNYVRAASAQRIGLLPGWASDVVAAGNTALRGARMLLLAPSRREALLESVRWRLSHVELASDPGFLDAFTEGLGFPAL